MTLFTFSLAQHVALTPADPSVEVVEGEDYMASAVPADGYQVRIVDNDGYDSDWSDEAVTHTWTAGATPLLVNVLSQLTPAAAELEAQVVMTRFFAGEAIAPDKTEADTFFTNAFVRTVVVSASGNVLRAASTLWTMKAAEYARLIDIDEAGSVRKLTQRFKQAKQMAEDMESKAKELDESETGDIRVAGKRVNLRGSTSNGWRVDGEFFAHGYDILINEFHLGGLPEAPPLGGNPY